MRRLLIEYCGFLDRISEIQNYLLNISNNESIFKIEKSFSDDEEAVDYINFLKSLKTSQVSYNAIIISLYGCIENYIDNLLGSYLELLSENKTQYSDLPDKLKIKYRNKLGEFLSNPQRFKNTDIDMPKEILNYSEILSSKLIGTISKTFALSHAGNLRFGEIISLMSDLGIENPSDRIISSIIFKNFWAEKGMEETDFAIKRARKNDDLFAPLETLVVQRNSVAHRWNVDERVTFQEINDSIIPFLIVLAECIFRICVLDACNFCKDYETFTIESPINTFRNNIVCFNSQSHDIAKGDYIVYQSEGKIKLGCIKRIEIDKKEIDRIESKQSINIGVQIDNSITKTDKLKTILNL